MSAIASSVYRPYLTDLQKLAKGIWPWTEGVRMRFPDHYKQQVIERHQVAPIPVHYKADPRKFTVDKYGVRHPVQNVAIPIRHVGEMDRGLWGGEGFVIGLRKKNDNPMKTRTPNIWRPRLRNRVFYSEILDQWLAIVVSQRTMDLIDENYGFDNYILKTHEVDIKSLLGMRLKRAMLLKLATGKLYPDNAERREVVLNKYKQFIVPPEEAEWVGLTLNEAEAKQVRLEEVHELATRRPLKEVFCMQLIEELKTPPDGTPGKESKSWFKNLNPFKSDEATT